MDGLKQVQDTQRARLDGESSFDSCIRTLTALKDLEIPTSIRTTLTKLSCDSFPEFCGYLDKSFPLITNISFDAIGLTGKGSSQKSKMPEPGQICKSIGRARSETSSFRISSHLINLERYGYYCQSADLGNAIFLSPSDHVSLCQENTSPNSINDGKLLIGSYDSSENPEINPYSTLGRFEEACASLLCAACPALYTCSGGCRSRIKFVSGSPSLDPDTQYWCNLARSLLKQELHDCFLDSSLYPKAKRVSSDDGSIEIISF